MRTKHGASEGVDAATRRVRRLLDDAGSPLTRANVLALCSGGADSVAMVALLAALPRGARPRELHVAWCDHRLRGDVAAEHDAAAAVASRVGATFHVLEADELLHDADGGVEAGARRWRLAAAAGLARQLECSHVATGHTTDDQVEQALLTLVGVTGRGGTATAMPVSRPLDERCQLVRPLLACTRAHVEQVLAELELDWADDPTNANADAHVRNAIRHRVVPQLLAIADGAGAALVRAAERERDAGDAVDSLASALLAAWDCGESLDVRLLATLDAGARRALIACWLRAAGLGRALDARLVASVEQLATAPGRAGSCSAIDLPGAACVRRDGYDLSITRRNPGGSPS